jgi:hypothetical protein
LYLFHTIILNELGFTISTLAFGAASFIPNSPYFCGMKNMIIFLFLLTSAGLMGQKIKSTEFRVVPLGVKGGIDESNLCLHGSASGHQ